MGIDFSYLLYFESNLKWNALKATADIAMPYEPPVKIVFPDHELLVPMQIWSDRNFTLQYDEPELDLSTSLYFEEDEAIRDYFHYVLKDDSLRSPPEGNKPRLQAVGFIYLTIYNESSGWYSAGDRGNTIAFNYGTTGTHMSLLFDESASIRKGFVELLERVPGVCGVFNREDSGEVFWYKGQTLSFQIPDPFLPLPQIEALLRSEYR